MITTVMMKKYHTVLIEVVNVKVGISTSTIYETYIRE